MQRIRHFVEGYKISQRLLSIPLIKAAFKVRKGLEQRIPIPGPLTTLALLGLSKMDNHAESLKTTKEALIAEADALYEDGEYEKASNLLKKYREDEDVEIMWRLSRSLYWQSRKASGEDAKRLIYEAHGIIELAMKLNENHPEIHKFKVVLEDTKRRYEGVRARLNYVYPCREHMLKVLELNPKDALALHMLGNWYFDTSVLPWYQKQILAVISGVAPKTSFEKALHYFETAEKINPKSHCRNLLYLAKTYLQLKRKDEAVKYLKMTVEFPAKNAEDYESKSEATKILETI